MQRARCLWCFATAVALVMVAPPRTGQAADAPAAPPARISTPEGWFTPPTPAVATPALPQEVKAAFVIPIREEITTKTFDTLRRKIAECKGKGAELVILDMDTWGGQVMPALDVARMLKTDLADVYTVCYARTRAISAGALIALACNEIVMTPVGKLGDCAPLLIGDTLEGVAREKIESVLRTEFAESAENHGYNIPLAESMVSIQREVWLVRHKKTRQLRYVGAGELSVTVPPGVSGAVSDPKSDWALLRVIVPEGELLTMTPRRARDYGFVKHIIKAGAADPYQELRDRYRMVAAPQVLADTWSESLVEFLTSPVVTSLLLMGGILLAYIEMHTPGFGVAGGLALACFAVLFGSRYLTGLANWWEIALLLLGVILLILEVTVIPGFGVAGVAGVMCIIVALLAMVIPNPPDKLPIPATDLDWSFLAHGAAALAVGFVLAMIAAAFVARYLPKLPVARRVFLGPMAEYTETTVTEDAPVKRVGVGDVGTVEGPCRPVGKVRFGEYLLDATADGEFIDAGQKVRILRKDGNHLIVGPIDET